MRDGRGNESGEEFRSMPIWLAIVVGLLWVNGPVLPLMFGTPALIVVLAEKIGILEGAVALILLGAGFVAGFILAWSWWSLTVPKWRLWAYRRVDDIAKLKQWAVAVGLTWPDGHVFENTEIKSAEQIAEQEELERRRRR
jgi:hypothetical protein